MQEIRALKETTNHKSNTWLRVICLCTGPRRPGLPEPVLVFDPLSLLISLEWLNGLVFSPLSRLISLENLNCPVFRSSHQYKKYKRWRWGKRECAKVSRFSKQKTVRMCLCQHVQDRWCWSCAVAYEKREERGGGSFRLGEHFFFFLGGGQYVFPFLETIILLWSEQHVFPFLEVGNTIFLLWNGKRLFFFGGGRHAFPSSEVATRFSFFGVGKMVYLFDVF